MCFKNGNVFGKQHVLKYIRYIYMCPSPPLKKTPNNLFRNDNIFSTSLAFKVVKPVILVFSNFHLQLGRGTNLAP